MKRTGISRLLPRFRLGYLIAGTLAVTATVAHAAVFFYNSGTTSGWDYIFTAGKPYNITSSNLRSRSSGYSIRAETRGGELDFSGRHHSEVIKWNVGKRGLVRWYGESFLIPDYNYDSGYVINQFFDKDVTKKPIILLTVRPDNKLDLTNIWNTDSSGCPATACYKQTLNYTFNRNTWYDLVWRINWQSNSTGRVEMWIKPASASDWTKIFDRTGINMYANDGPIEFHAGAYALGSADLSPGEVRYTYVDEFRFGDSNSSPNEVAPR